MKNYSITFRDITELSTSVKAQSIKDSEQLLIQCFSETTDTKEISLFQDFFHTYFPKATLIGTTSDGVIGNDHVYVKEKHVAIFTQFEKTTINSAIVKHSDSLQNNYDSGTQIAQKLTTPTTKVMISFADGTHTNGDEYLRGINTVSPGLIISGGLAGDNGELKKTYIFDKNEIVSKGAIAAVLDSDVLHVTTDYGFDWIPIGKHMSITKSINNRVYEIEGIPAVDIYAKYLGREVANSLPQVGIEFPLVFHKGGNLIGRAVLHKHDDGSLTFAGNIEEGEKVRFGIGDVEMILRGTDYHLQKLLKHSSHKIETIFIYSCMARRRFLNEYIQKEISAYSNIATTAGFFTYGEFFSDHLGTRLYNETITILTLSESEEKMHIPKHKKVQKDIVGADALHAITHLSNIVSEEFEDLNNNLEKRIQRTKKTIYEQVYADKLTQLPNRLKLFIDMPYRVGHTFVLINIDEFTVINDFYGHHVGDLVLKELSKLLTKISDKENAKLYKLPSDEFAMIVPPYKSHHEFTEHVHNLLTNAAKIEVIYNDTPIHITVTVAASILTEDELGYSNAGMALKLAKKSKKSFIFYDTKMLLNKQYESNLQVANALRKAIKSNNIVPYFQPIIDLKSGKITKYESLARLIDDEDQILMPTLFLPISQKLKLYPQVTEIMITKTFERTKRTKKDFTINLSIHDINNDTIQEFIFEKLESYDIATQITFEILETKQIENDEKVQQFINKLKKVGAKIAIDDFGSGFANFEYLTKINADYIKIDGSLIKDIDTDKNARIVVETIVNFAQKLGIKTVAEYVHSKAILEVIKTLEIDYAQGYFYGKPQEELLTSIE